MNKRAFTHHDVIMSGKVFRTSRWNFKRSLIEKFHSVIPHITNRYMNVCIKNIAKCNILEYNEMHLFYRFRYEGNMNQVVLLLRIPPII
jgi:hypothetical protein